MRLLAAAAVVALAACATATIEDAVPQAALETAEETVPPADATIAVADAAATDSGAADVVAVDVPEDDAVFAAGPVDTGRYPNLNIPQKAETEQISDAEKAETTQKLREAQKRASAAGSGGQPSDVAELRRLGRTHGNEALEEIESGQ